MSSKELMTWDDVERIRKAVEAKEKATGQVDEEGRAFIKRAEAAASKNEKMSSTMTWDAVARIEKAQIKKEREGTLTEKDREFLKRAIAAAEINKGPRK